MCIRDRGWTRGRYRERCRKRFAENPRQVHQEGGRPVRGQREGDIDGLTTSESDDRVAVKGVVIKNTGNLYHVRDTEGNDLTCWAKGNLRLKGDVYKRQVRCYAFKEVAYVNP